MVSNSKYDCTVINVPNTENKSVMKLRIKGMVRSDVGVYECVAKNAHGESRGKIRVHESAKQAPAVSRTETDISTRLSKYAVPTSSRK